MKPIKKKQGFTIVELVIVIGVIGILAAILIPTFINLNNKAQVSSNQSFVKNLNTQMAIREQEEGKNNTMFEAVKDAKDIGFDVEKLTPVDNRDLVWDSRSDRFALLNSDGSVFFSEGKWELNAGDEHKIWKIYASMPTTEQKFSIYAKEGWEGTEVSNLQVGFDVGYNEGFESISYVGKEGAVKTVTIRTNGADTTLTVNNAADTVYHYDLLGKADIVKTAENSFHEFGKTGYAQIASGRLVAEKGGYINTAALVGNAVLEIKAGGVVENKYASSADYIAYNNAKEGAYQFPADAVKTADELEVIAADAVSTVDPKAKIIDVYSADDFDGEWAEQEIVLRNETNSVTLKTLVKENVSFRLMSDVHLINSIAISHGREASIDLNGHELSFEDASIHTELTSGDKACAVYVEEGAKLTIEDSGQGGMMAAHGNILDEANPANFFAIVWVDGELVINGGKIYNYCGMYEMQATTGPGTVIVNGGDTNAAQIRGGNVTDNRG